MFGVDDAIAAGLKIIDKFVPDPAEKEKAAFELAQLKQQSELAILNADTQIAVATAATNTAEASNPSAFVSGWRPAIGWVCATSLALYFVPQFIMAVILWTRLCFMQNTILPYPVSINDVITLTLGMLGIVVNRTVEKMNGVARIK